MVQLIGSPDGRWLVRINAEGLPQIQETSSDEQTILSEYIWLNRHDRYGGLIHKGKALACNDNYLLFSDIRDVHVVDMQMRQHLHVLQAEADIVVNCALARTVPIAATTTLKGNATVWDLGTGREIMRLHLGQTVHACAFAPDGSYLLTGDGNLLTEDFSGRGGLLRAWPITEQCEEYEHRQTGGVTAFYYNPRSEYFLSATENGSVVLHDLEAESDATSFDLEPGFTGALLLDEKLFFASPESSLRYIDLANREAGVKTLSDSKVEVFAGSRDGTLLATFNPDDNALEVWDASTDTKLFAQHCPGHNVKRLAFSLDSSLILVVGRHKISWLSVASQQQALLLDGKETVRDGWNQLRDYLVSKNVPARPLDAGNYSEEFLDAVLTPDASCLLTVSRLAPQGDPHAFQFVFTETGMDSARHLDPFPHYILLSGWSFGSRNRTLLDAENADHHKIQVLPEGTCATWITNYMGSFSIRTYNLKEERLLVERKAGLVDSQKVTLELGEFYLVIVDVDGLLSIYDLRDLTLLCSGYVTDRGLSCVSIIEKDDIVLLGYESGDVDVLQMRNVARPVPVSPVCGHAIELSSFVVNNRNAYFGSQIANADDRDSDDGLIEDS